jgi:hypothetical protein
MIRKSDFIFKIFLIGLIALPAMAMGAVHPIVQGGTFIAAALFIVYLFAVQKAPLPRIDLTVALFLGLTLVTLIQIIPLPSNLVALVAPSLFEVRSRALTPLNGEVPGVMPLTLDTPFTLLELGKLCLYSSVYFGVVYWTRRRGPSFVLQLTVMTGMAAAAIFLAHRIMLPDKIYGFYTPIHVSVSKTRISAPLINPNHMAGLLGLCTTVAIGSALAVTDRSKRLLLIGITALAGGTLMLTLSRGGIAAFVTGQLLFILLRIIAKQRRHLNDESQGHLSWLPIGIALSIGAGFFAAQDAIIGEFVDGDIKKLDMALEGIPLITQFWSTGVGRGSFGVAFPMVSTVTANHTVTHAENAMVQILADYGVPIGGAALLISLWIIGSYLKAVPKRVELAAAVAALVAFGIHNLVDYNSEVPGTAVVAVALLGVLSGSRPIHKHRSLPRLSTSVVIATALITAVVGIASIAYVHDHNRDTEERRLLARWKQLENPLYKFDSMQESLLRHPADWFIPYITGVRAYHLGTENPLPWLARAIELNPRAAMAHLYVGGTLLRAGHLDQAMLEMRLATRSRPQLVKAVARLLVNRMRRFDEISKIAVTRADKKLIWPALALLFSRQGLSVEAEIADLAILQIDGMNPPSLARHARRLTSRGETEQALTYATRLKAHPDLGPSGIVLEAEIHAKQGAISTAIACIEKGIKQYGNTPSLLTALAWHKQKSGDFGGAIEVVNILKGTATTVERRADILILEAEISEAEGRMQATLARLREAYALTPWNTRIIERIATLSKQNGDLRRTLEALRTLSQARPEDAKIKAELEQLEKDLKYKSQNERQ